MKTSKFGNVNHYMLNLVAIEAARPDAIALRRELMAIWPEYAEFVAEMKAKHDAMTEKKGERYSMAYEVTVLDPDDELLRNVSRLLNEGLNLKETAKRLHTKPRTIKTRFHRATMCALCKLLNLEKSEEIERARELRRAGYSVSEIVKTLGCNYDTTVRPIEKGE